MFMMLLEVNLTSMAAAIVAGITGVASAISMGLAICKSAEAISRQPEVSDKIRSQLLLGLAFLETLAIYGLLVAILLITNK